MPYGITAAARAVGASAEAGRRLRTGIGTALTTLPPPARPSTYPSATSRLYASVTVDRDTRRSAATLRVGPNRSPGASCPSTMALPKLLVQLHAQRPRIARIEEQLHEEDRTWSGRGRPSWPFSNPPTTDLWCGSESVRMTCAGSVSLVAPSWAAISGFDWTRRWAGSSVVRLQRMVAASWPRGRCSTPGHLGDVASYGRELLTGSPAVDRVSRLAFPPAVSLTTLTFAVVLAVFKPLGTNSPPPREMTRATRDCPDAVTHDEAPGQGVEVRPTHPGPGHRYAGIGS